MPRGAEWGTVALEVDVARTVRALGILAADAAAERVRWEGNRVVAADLDGVADAAAAMAHALDVAGDMDTLRHAGAVLIDGWHTLEGFRAWVS